MGQPKSPPEVWLPEGTPWLPGGGIWVEGGGPDPTVPPPGGGSRRVLFADALGLPLASLRQYPPGPPRGFEGPPPGSEPSGERGGCEGLRGDPGGGQDPESWMRPGQGRPQEVEEEQPPPLCCSADPDPEPAPSLPPLEAEQPPTQNAEDEAVARELEQLYLSHLRRLRGGPGDNTAPPPTCRAPPLPERGPNTSLAAEMALHHEGAGGGGRRSPPELRGMGGPVVGALVVPARPPPGRGGGDTLGGALRRCGVVLALAVLVPVACGDGGGPTAALALGIYLALTWLT